MLVIKQIGHPLPRSSRFTDLIGLHSVPLPLQITILLFQGKTNQINKRYSKGLPQMGEPINELHAFS